MIRLHVLGVCVCVYSFEMICFGCLTTWTSVAEPTQCLLTSHTSVCVSPWSLVHKPNFYFSSFSYYSLVVPKKLN